MIIENVLILDTETTGLNPSKGAKCIEIAAVLYNIKHKCVLQNFSTLLPCEQNPVEHINNITAESTRLRMPLDDVSKILVSMASHAQAFVAHNASFDKTFVHTIPEMIIDLPWICTVNQFDWGIPLSRKRLQDVCVGFGIGYDDAHRALTDCHFMVKCFNKIDDLQERIDAAYEMVVK